MQSINKNETGADVEERLMLLKYVTEQIDNHGLQAKEKKEARVVSAVLVNRLRDSGLQTLKKKREAPTTGEPQPSTSKSDADEASCGAVTNAKAKRRSLRTLLEDCFERSKQEVDHKLIRVENESKRLRLDEGRLHLDEERLRLEEKKLEMERARQASEAESRRRQDDLLIALVQKAIGGNQSTGI